MFQFFLIGLLVLANIRLSQKPADIVVVAPDGKSTYLTPSIAGEALVRFLADQTFHSRLPQSRPGGKFFDN